MGAAWTGLSQLPAPVATFGAWVLKNALCDHLALQEVESQVIALHRAVRKVGFRFNRVCAVVILDIHGV